MLHYMYNCFKHHRIFNIHMKFFGVSIFLFMGVHDKSNSYSWLFPLKQIHTHQRSWMTQIHTHRKFMRNSLFFIRILTMNNANKVYMIMNSQFSYILEFTSDYASVIVEWDACSTKAFTKNKKLQFSFFPVIFFDVKRELVKRKRNWISNI